MDLCLDEATGRAGGIIGKRPESERAAETDVEDVLVRSNLFQDTLCHKGQLRRLSETDFTLMIALSLVAARFRAIWGFFAFLDLREKLCLEN